MNYYNEIKNEIIDIETYKKVKDYSKNKRELEGYYKIGELLIEAQGGEEKAIYGNKIIKEYSKKLTEELGKGYSWRNLYNMRTYYLFFSKNEILQPLATILSWTHYCIILSLKDINKIRYYISECKKYNLGKRELQQKIKSNEYERLDNKTKQKLINNEESKIGDYIKKPILIKLNKDINIVSEKILKTSILENIEEFMSELGDGYSFIKSEYKIKDYETNNYIDILLFNYIYNCFVVIELKITELKKEHIGQTQIYMEYIDKNLKQPTQNKTIGIIVTKKENEFVMHYCNNNSIYQTTYLTVNEKILEYT